MTESSTQTSTQTVPGQQDQEVSDLAIDLRALARVLRAVVPFSGESIGSRPEYSCVRIEAGSGVLAATTGSQYVLTHARAETHGGRLPRLWIHQHAAAALLRILTVYDQNAGDSNSLYTPIGPLTQLTITGSWPKRFVVRAYSSVLFSCDPVDVTDPADYDSLVAETAKTAAALSVDPSAPPMDTFGISVRLLAQLADAVGADLPTPWRFTTAGPSRAIRVEYGSWFLALIMPARMGVGMTTVPFGLPGAGSGGAR